MAPPTRPPEHRARSVFDLRFFFGLALGVGLTLLLNIPSSSGLPTSPHRIVTEQLYDSLPPSVTSKISEWTTQLSSLIPGSPLHQRSEAQLSARTYCYRGGVMTLDENNTVHKCLTVSKDGNTFENIFTPTSVEDGLEVGASDDAVSATSQIGSKYKWHDGMAVPGLWDGHGHVLSYGEMLESVQLFGAGSLEEVRKRVKEYVAAHPGTGTKDNWIRGVGWDQAYFGGQMPTAADLSSDPALADLYILLDRVDVHCAWASTAVLELLPDPLPPVPGGFYPSSGVFCDNAMELPLSQYPYPNDTTISGFLESAQTSLHNFGIVGVHEASVLPRTLQVYDALADARRLSLRVYAMLECETRNSFCLHDQVPDHRRQIPEPHYKKMGKTGHPILRSVKLFADGALGSRGAALLEPYSDDPTTSGTLLVEPPELKRVAGEWIRAGWQVNIHAIGDRANRAAVDALIEGLGSLCQSGESEEERLECILSHQRRLRCRIEHAQIVSPEDQVRIHKYGIIASIQPTHAISDSRYAEDRLGPERLESSAYRIKTFLQNKGRIVLGSDFPVESPDVVAGMRAAVLRKDVEGREFLKEEGIDWDSALKGFTTGPAYGAGLEKVAGTIECGKWADWVVVRDVKEWYGKEKPILEQEQGEEKLELAKIESGYGEWQIRETWTRGKRVYKKESEVEVEA